MNCPSYNNHINHSKFGSVKKYAMWLGILFSGPSSCSDDYLPIVDRGHFVCDNAAQKVASCNVLCVLTHYYYISLCCSSPSVGSDQTSLGLTNHSHIIEPWVPTGPLPGTNHCILGTLPNTCHY